MAPKLVDDPDLVTPAWLTDVLRHGGAIGDDARVVAFTASYIGTGQVGANVRYALTYDGPPGPPTIVAKFSSRDALSAATGVATLTYETEVAFYNELASTVDISRPHFYYAELEHGTANVVLVMEDLAPGEQGDQIAGCDVDAARLAVEEAAKLHGPRWGDPTLGNIVWLDRSSRSGDMATMLPSVWNSFADRYRSTLHPVTLAAGPELVSLLPQMMSYTPAARTPIHYDYRLDNMLFGGPRPLVVVDWQTVQLGMGPQDVAYFLGNAFEPEVRRSSEHALVEGYHRALVDDYAVDDYPFDQCWSDYVRSSYASLLMAIFASMMVGQTERGDAMFMAMANRSAQMAADLDAPGVIHGR